jgi:hypothetical protein
MKSLLWHISDTGGHVGEPGARVNAVQLCGLDQAVHSGGAFPALIRTRKEPGLPPKGRAAQHALCGVIRQANAPKSCDANSQNSRMDLAKRSAKGRARYDAKERSPRRINTSACIPGCRRKCSNLFNSSGAKAMRATKYGMPVR